jgi:predicted DNA-binding protein with PD1-like motif
MTFGERDGAPFFHCHALWRQADGRIKGGHILPEETVVAEPFAVEAFGIDGAVFAAEPDPETNFKLFGPIASAAFGIETTSRAFALRLRPNRDFAGALEAFCRERGIISARLHGGVGSTTELAVSSGVIVSGTGGALEAELDIALVDYEGGIAEGRLLRGDNPVLMTMELVLEVLGEQTRP